MTKVAVASIQLERSLFVHQRKAAPVYPSERLLVECRDGMFDVALSRHFLRVAVETGVRQRNRNPVVMDVHLASHIDSHHSFSSKSIILWALVANNKVCFNVIRQLEGHAIFVGLARPGGEAIMDVWLARS